MDEGGRWRWERALVVLALLLGIAAMHAVVAPMTPDHSASASPAAQAGTAMSQDVMADGSGADAAPGGPAATVGGPADPAAPMPLAHNLMHLCLAVLAAAVALGMAVIVFMMARVRELSTAAPRRTRSVTVAGRPPARTAVRLAQLCVLRN